MVSAMGGWCTFPGCLVDEAVTHRSQQLTLSRVNFVLKGTQYACVDFDDHTVLWVHLKHLPVSLKKQSL